MIALDPDYALAHAGLADCYSIHCVYGWFPPEVSRPPAQEAVTRAMALDPMLAEVHFSQALHTFCFSRSWRAAVAHVQKALAINPRMAMAQAYLGVFLGCEYRHDEAVIQARAAQEVDPHSPFIHFFAALTLVLAGRFELADRAARRSLDLQSDSLTGLYALGLALSGLQRHDEAIAAMERAVTLSRAPFFVGYLGLIYGRGHRDRAACRYLISTMPTPSSMRIGVS